MLLSATAPLSNTARSTSSLLFANSASLSLSKQFSKWNLSWIVFIALGDVDAGLADPTKVQNFDTMIL